MYKLTKQDINALRKADDVCFYYNQKEGNYLIAIKEATRKEKENNPFIRDCQFKINLDTEINPKPKPMKAFASAYSETFKGIAEFLKPNDQIKLEWYKDALTNQYLIEQNLHGDALYLRVERERGKSIKFFKFLIDTSICPDNTARMIKAA